MAESPLVITDKFIEEHGLTHECEEFVARNINNYGSSYLCRVDFITDKGLYPEYEAYEKKCQDEAEADFRKKQFTKPVVSSDNPFYDVWKYVEENWNPEETFYNVGEDILQFLMHFSLKPTKLFETQIDWLVDAINSYKMEYDGDDPKSRSIKITDDGTRQIHLIWKVNEEEPEDIYQWEDFYFYIGIEP